MSETQPMTKQRLATYLYIRLGVENMLERLRRLENETQIPAMRQSDGSQHTQSRGDRMERAVIRYMEYKDRVTPRIQADRLELAAIEDAIYSLADPLEREVLRLRYTESDTCENMKWADICRRIYGNDNESRMRTLYDIHRRALENISAQ